MAIKNVATHILLVVTAMAWIFASTQAKNSTISFYMHDNVGGPNQTAIPVAGAGNSSSSNMGFGTVTVIDDALTEGASPSSKPVGRGQGTWIVSALDGQSLLLTFSAVFQSDPYNGSTISFHGADIIRQPTREIAVVGGTGIFRFCRGFAVINTASFSPASVVLKIDVTMVY